MSAHLCPTAPAFRIRVSISAMGSVIIVRFDPLPACLPDAWNFTLERLLTETDTADSKLPDEPTRASAPVTAIAVPAREFGLAIVPFDQSLPGHRLPLSAAFCAMIIGISPRNGKPIALSKASATSSLSVVVTTVMSMP